MCNLFLTMMDRMGVHVEHFGDSTGRLTVWIWPDMQFPDKENPPLGVIFDSDIGTASTPR